MFSRVTRTTVCTIFVAALAYVSVQHFLGWPAISDPMGWTPFASTAQAQQMESFEPVKPSDPRPRDQAPASLQPAPQPSYRTSPRGYDYGWDPFARPTSSGASFPARGPYGATMGLPRFPQGGNVRMNRRARIVWETFPEEIPEAEMERRERIQKSRASLFSAKTEDAKKEAQSELRQSLEDQFDQDYERRENELAALEERISHLRSKLDKRKTARDEIIDVRYKTYLHEADGLTFPDVMGSLDPPAPPWRLPTSVQPVLPPSSASPDGFSRVPPQPPGSR